jgi:fatty-acyl-CoA synthase
VLHSLAPALPDVIDLGESSRVLAVVPMFHATPGMPFYARSWEPRRTWGPPRSASIVDLLESESVTYAAGVLTIWHGLLRH